MQLETSGSNVKNHILIEANLNVVLCFIMNSTVTKEGELILAPLGI